MAYAIAGMVAMAVAMGIGRFVFTPILPGMMDGLGLSVSHAGLIASANYAGYLAGALLAVGGWAAGRERGIALACLGATAVLAAAMGLTDNVVLFLGIRFLAGVASAFVMIFLSTILFARFAAAGRDDLEAWHFGGVGLGIAVSAILIGVLLCSQAEWQAGWLWSGALSLAGLVVVAALVDAGPAQTHRPAPEPAMPGSPALTRLILAYGLFGFGYIVTATFLVAIVRDGDAGRMFEAVVWLATGLAGLPSVWLWGKIARRIGLASAFAISCMVEAAGVVASVAAGGYVGPLIGGILLGGTFIPVTAMGLKLGRSLAGSAPRRVLAWMTAAFGLGQILGPIAAAFVAARTGSFVAPSLMAAAALVAAAVIGHSARPRARD
jgi:predicted MFS family arabinose efflux permease